ncbi:unnamed protein product [Cyprideis torosa]|uniref:Uncharacterized protein n=1 Tax=Cyprideis torosa TaxID=163714 RepID=A0A7R8W806_9CRUS|nr:unnamed protein product [Cyprideis torosa]CAG0886938.1 unnamed protein product [Cyprideis torosa]
MAAATLRAPSAEETSPAASPRRSSTPVPGDEGLPPGCQEMFLEDSSLDRHAPVEEGTGQEFSDYHVLTTVCLEPIASRRKMSCKEHFGNTSTDRLLKWNGFSTEWKESTLAAFQSSSSKDLNRIEEFNNTQQLLPPEPGSPDPEKKSGSERNLSAMTEKSSSSREKGVVAAENKNPGKDKGKSEDFIFWPPWWYEHWDASSGFDIGNDREIHEDLISRDSAMTQKCIEWLLKCT